MVLESESEFVTTSDSSFVVDAPLESETEITGTSRLTSVCRSILSGESEFVGKSLCVFKVITPLETETENSVSVILSCFVGAPLETESEIESVSTKGFYVKSVLEGESEFSSKSLSSYLIGVALEGETEVVSSVVASYITTAPNVSESDFGDITKVWSIVKTALESETEIPPGIVEAISSFMLALYGKSLQATTFSNFNFDSFVEENGVTFASGPDGIYKVGESVTDDGVVINPEATIDFRKLGSNKVKQLVSIYADDGSQCRVDLDGVSQDYTASGNGRFSCRHTHLGKKLKVTFSDFESLSAVEMFLYHLSRRG